ncbi:MAG: putative secreted protein [Mycobacterium sp.]|nr:putative secreted protein [Mycobacterium sp.]
MRRFAAIAAVFSAVWLALTLVTPMSASWAAQDVDTSTIPTNPYDTLEMKVTANCVLADNQCYFTTAASLLGPGGPIPFPGDFWGKQTTTVRSMDRMVYMDSDFNAPNTRMFKSITDTEYTTVYFGSGPPEKFMLNGSSRTTDWATGRPKTDADYIVCSHIQVVYAGVNLTSPDACAQTRY